MKLRGLVASPCGWGKIASHCAAQACAKYVARATEEMGAINIYEIYADVCRDWRADADGRQLLRALAGPDTLLRQGKGYGAACSRRADRVGFMQKDMGALESAAASTSVAPALDASSCVSQIL